MVKEKNIDRQKLNTRNLSFKLENYLSYNENKKSLTDNLKGEYVPNIEVTLTSNEIFLRGIISEYNNTFGIQW